MTTEMIEKFVEADERIEIPANIFFKQRSTITGLFIKANDYHELKPKNLWRVVTKSNLEQWKKTKSMNFVKIFNGNDFSKLTVDKKYISKN